jgi:outer membrane protein assembly factor BamB
VRLLLLALAALSLAAAPAAPLAAGAAAVAEDEASEKGFVRIWNGTDLSGWSGDPEVWSVRDGAITGETGNGVQLEHNSFLVWTGGRPADFELRLEYRLRGGNSGIYFHAEKKESGEPLIGPQADISHDHEWTGDIMEWKKRDLLAERGERVRIDKDGKKHVVGSVGDPAKLLDHVKDDGWNDYHVIARGNRVTLEINGVLMCELTDEDPRRATAGHLALQVHVGPPMTVEFRNIRIREDSRGDWPTYNCDVLGSRHNAGETALGKADVGRLEEKWRFPPRGADFEIGAVHATPVVVNGHVYFGTVNEPAFYKLTPDGKVKWSFRLDEDKDRVAFKVGFHAGIYGSALVTDDAVYFATLAGFVYALDRKSGRERWRLDMRAQTFPDAHPLNGTFASPILADGKVVVAGGALEQGIRHFDPGYEGFTGRGFVIALEPGTGRLAWKYDVGPKPERLDPPITIEDAWGKHVFQFGPATSTVWSTPSYDAASRTLFFGTDTNNAPRRPTQDDPRLDTRYACAVIAIDARDGAERWVTQINRGDVWMSRMRAYDPKTGRYLDQSIGDTPRVFTVPWDGTPTLVVGFGCKNGGFYIARAADGTILNHTPLYEGPPAVPLDPPPDKRMLALPGPIGGLQTGCATDGKRVYTNGIDANQLGTQESSFGGRPPSGGRVVAVSLDAREEHWRHERPKVASIGGPPPRPVFKDVGDPVASGLAVANDVVYFTTLMTSRLTALDAATGKVLREIQLPPVWSGPAVSRGRVYVGTGNIVLPHFFLGPTQSTGTIFSFGLPGEDEVSRIGGGNE